jgi:hypothetical protein
MGEVAGAFAGDNRRNLVPGKASPLGIAAGKTLCSHSDLLKAQACLPNCGKCNQPLNGPISAPSLRRAMSSPTFFRRVGHRRHDLFVT